MNAKASEYRNAQVASALVNPEGTHHYTKRYGYTSPWVTTNMTAAIQFARGADHEPAAGLYCSQQILLACGWDATGCNLQK